MGFIKDKLVGFFADKAGGLVKDIGDTVDKFHLSGEEKQEFRLKMREIDYQFKSLGMEMQEQILKDKQSAREMYSKDSSSQKILTIIFTVGYFGLTTFMLAFLLNKLSFELDQFTTVFISTIFGAFNAIMVQIISFYFGSSQGGEDTGRQIASSFNKAVEK